MPGFTVKDLMITVLPEKPADVEKNAQNAQGLIWVACTAITCGCTEGCTRCTCTGSCYNVHVTAILMLIPNQPQQDLITLKMQLQEQLAAIEAQEKALQPQSVEEIETIEARLNEALDELKAQKTRFKKSRKR